MCAVQCEDLGSAGLSVGRQAVDPPQRDGTYSGWRLKDTSGPSCFGLACLGSQLDLVTALGSKDEAGKRASSKLSNLLYMYGWFAPLMLTVLAGGGGDKCTREGVSETATNTQ